MSHGGYMACPCGRGDYSLCPVHGDSPEATAERRRVLSEAIAAGPDSGMNAVHNEGRRAQMERVAAVLMELAPYASAGHTWLKHADVVRAIQLLWNDIPRKEGR